MYIHGITSILKTCVIFDQNKFLLIILIQEFNHGFKIRKWHYNYKVLAFKLII
jgi:hypothetical protein